MTLNQICWAVLFGLLFLELYIVARHAAKVKAQRRECERDPLAAARLLQEMRQRPTIIPAPPAREAQTDEPQTPPAPEAAPATLGIYMGNNAFAGEKVAFTGSLKGMKRRDAINAVESNGGTGYTDMPAGTTLLVVGNKPGKGKMDKAERWGIRRIDEMTFRVMMRQPLTLEPDEFAALVNCLG